MQTSSSRLIIALALATFVALPSVAANAQRFGRRFERGLGAGGGTPEFSQVWRVPSLTLSQRAALRDLQETTMRRLRDGGRPGRGEMLRVREETVAHVQTIVGVDSLTRAKQMPSGPLAVEELVYYPVTSLPDLSPERRAKIEAVFAPIMAEARADALAGRGSRRQGLAEPGAPGKAGKDGKARQRGRAMFEVLDALLTRDQMAAVRQFLPTPIKSLGFKPQVVMRLPSLTLEQEGRVRAVFAAFEDETTADRARRETIKTELRAADTSQERRAQLIEERRGVEARLEAKQKAAYGELSKVLSADQMKELAATGRGPRRPLVFTPEAIRALALSPEQQRAIGAAMQSFRRETSGERQELGKLRGAAKDGDIQSMENAPLRDKLRKSAGVVEDERDELTRVIANVLTADQLSRLVREASSRKEAAE